MFAFCFYYISNRLIFVFWGKIDYACQTSDPAVRIAKEYGDIYSKSMAYTSRGLYLYLNIKGIVNKFVFRDFWHLPDKDHPLCKSSISMP